MAMDNPNNPYGQYLLLLLSQMMKKKANLQEDIKIENVEWEYFGKDETESRWRREERVELLKAFCREGYPMASRHGHFLLGEGDLGSYIAIPGRFLLAEQPAGGTTGFTLWQPLKGGEIYYNRLEDMGQEEASMVYGYWIAAINPQTLEISEV